MSEILLILSDFIGGPRFRIDFRNCPNHRETMRQDNRGRVSHRECHHVRLLPYLYITLCRSLYLCRQFYELAPSTALTKLHRGNRRTDAQAIRHAPVGSFTYLCIPPNGAASGATITRWNIFFFFLSFFSPRRFERTIRKRPNTVRCLAVKRALLGTRHPRKEKEAALQHQNWRACLPVR